MKEGLKYKIVYPNGETAADMVIVKITEVSVFSKNVDYPESTPARNSIKKFLHCVQKGFYIIEQ